MKKSTVRYLILTKNMQFVSLAKTISVKDKLELMSGTDRIIRKLHCSDYNYYLYDRSKSYAQNLIDVEDSFDNYKPNTGTNTFNAFLVPNKIKAAALRFDPDLSVVIDSLTLINSKDTYSLRLKLNRQSFSRVLKEQMLHPASPAEQHHLKASYVLKSPTNCFFLTSNSISIAD